jgi:hypothetical protein
MKNSNDTIGNRNRDLPACSAVPQPTAPPRTPYLEGECSLEVCLRETGYANMSRVEFNTQDCSASKEAGEKAKAIGVILKRVIMTTYFQSLL